MSENRTENQVLPDGLPRPVPAPDGLDTEYWEGTRRHELLVQRCGACGAWQWGPEWICHSCHEFGVGWERVDATGVIYSWQRPWHPVHPALRDLGPYVILLVELPHAGGIRMVGNLVGDQLQQFAIGDAVEAVFEDHDSASVPYTLVQWRLVKPGR